MTFGAAPASGLAQLGPPEAEAIRPGTATLRRSGLDKVIEGQTTRDEILRVAASDN